MEPLSIIGALALSIAASFFHTRKNDEHPTLAHYPHEAQSGSISPKFLIISAFKPEAEAWYGIPEFDLLGQNITVPGLSSLFPGVHCTKDNAVCQVTLGEGKINAALSMSSVISSASFNLTKTYFLIAGTAGISPLQGTSADVTFARYAVQGALQNELDAREKPNNFSTGYFPQGAAESNEYPQELYGTEIYEVNDNLRKLAVATAKNAKLNDTTLAQTYRANYAPGTAANSPRPSIRECDTVTSDTYFSGGLLADAFSNYTTLVTNGTGVYCTSQQEDNGILEALLRGAANHLVDLARIIIMRSASDFDRPYAGESQLQSLVFDDPGSFDVSCDNLYLTGIQVINTGRSQWKSTFEQGIPANNYIGDILGTLGGTPDFGNGNPLPNGIIPAAPPTQRLKGRRKHVSSTRLRRP